MSSTESKAVDSGTHAGIHVPVGECFNIFVASLCEIASREQILVEYRGAACINEPFMGAQRAPPLTDTTQGKHTTER